jgi:hypothetical protein
MSVGGKRLKLSIANEEVHCKCFYNYKWTTYGLIPYRDKLRLIQETLKKNKFALTEDLDAEGNIVHVITTSGQCQLNEDPGVLTEMKRLHKVLKEIEGLINF